MSMIEKGIECDVPVSTAYNQWTQFEEFPRFMEGVEKVEQIDDQRLTWTAEIGGVQKVWISKITEQIPDERIAWVADGDVGHSGVVTFHYLEPERCKVMVQMEYMPESFTEKVGDMLGIVGRRIEGDLKRFKDFIESRGAETGAWRGEIRRTG